VPSGKMRVNISVYYTAEMKVNEFGITSACLLPTNSLLNSIKTTEFSHETNSFTIPQSPFNPLYFASCPFLNSNTKMIDWYDFNGAMRNILVFDTILTNDELIQLYKRGVCNRYLWNESNEKLALYEIQKNKTLSILNVESVQDLNIKKCATSQIVSEFPDEFFNLS
jgi:hypothetical protein